MSVLIKGLDMPKLGESITIYPDGRAVCYDTYTGGTIRGNAVEIPPHGRLIDADALIDGRVSNDNVVIHAKTAPTIIEAEVDE